MSHWFPDVSVDQLREIDTPEARDAIRRLEEANHPLIPEVTKEPLSIENQRRRREALDSVWWELPRG